MQRWSVHKRTCLPSWDDDAVTRRAELEKWSRTRYVPPYWFALMSAGMGDLGTALAWLERGFEVRDAWLVWLKTDPRLDCLRSGPRFQHMLERVGLGIAPRRSIDDSVHAYDLHSRPHRRRERVTSMRGSCCALRD